MNDRRFAIIVNVIDLSCILSAAVYVAVLQKRSQVEGKSTPTETNSLIASFRGIARNASTLNTSF